MSAISPPVVITRDSKVVRNERLKNIAPYALLILACIITTGPTEDMAPIPDRMQVILQPEQFDAWLDPGNNDTAALAAMLGPCRADLMAAYPVSLVINSGRVEGAECIEPVELR